MTGDSLIDETAPAKTTEAKAYVQGWEAFHDGDDGRFSNAYRLTTESELYLAWTAGFVNAMRGENDPDPRSAGFGP